MSPSGFLRRRGIQVVLLSFITCAPAGSPVLAQREAESLSASFRKAAEHVLPSVVAVRPLGLIEPGFPYPPIGGPRFFPGQVMPPGLPRIGRHLLDAGAGPTGSGVVIDVSKGLILTTEQVVSGAPRAALIFTDGREVEAQRVVRDPHSELVLLAIDPQSVRLKEAEWGSSQGLRLGDWVLSIGRPSAGTHAVSAGIVSGLGAGPAPGGDDDAIRTDAVMNGANAGGPLVDLEGKVVGINRSGRDPGGRQDGFGYAIPAERARRFAKELADFGQVRRGYLGLMLGPERGESSEFVAGAIGLIVTGVSPGGPAADAGVRVGDRLVAVDGRPISSLEALSRTVEIAPIGQDFRLTVDRAGKRFERVVKSRSRPDSPRNMPGAVGPAPRALAPRRRAGDRKVEPAPKDSNSPGGPVLRSESPDDTPAQKPAPAPKPDLTPAPRPEPGEPERAPDAAPDQKPH
jgi:serine protease Do